MIKKLLIASTIASAALITGCAGVASPAAGTLYADVTWDGAVANNGVAGTKTGEACAKSYLGVYAAGDASLEAAKAAAGITKVATVGHTSKNILGIIGTYCTVVTGE